MYLIDCIVPYPNLMEVVTEVWAEHPNRDEIEFRAHPKAVYDIPDYKLYGDVAIARGMSVQYLKTFYPEIPIVEIPMSAYDVFTAFTEAKKENPKHVGLIGLQSTIYGVKEMGSSFFTKFSVYEVSSDMKYPEVVSKALADGVDFIVAGNAVCEYTSKIGVKSSLIRTSKSSVRHAIDEAILILEYSRAQKARTERLQAVMDNVSAGILSVDENKNISICNSDACKYLNCQASAVIGKPIDDVFPFLNDPDISKQVGSSYGSVLRINDRDFSVSKIPLRLDGNFAGAVIIFHRTNAIRDMEVKIRQTISNKGLFAKYGFDDIIGRSSGLVATKALAMKYSKVDASILIVGETGTGKEMFAQSIHKTSNRSSGPFVAINCAALPENLLESELFGYAPGAFTGASKNGKIGLFELAHNGTIFLDEISEMSLSLQGRLLRVLAEHSIMRLGDDSVMPVDVRIISATNRDIEEDVKSGRFRRDLFFRLNVLRLDIPPLRNRGNDIIILAKYFLEYYYKKYGGTPHRFTADCYPYLTSYSFPGNVRELQNVCERLSVVIDNRDIVPEDLSEILIEENNSKSISISEEKLIREALINFKNKSDAAKYLGIDRSTLYRKMSKFGITEK